MDPIKVNEFRIERALLFTGVMDEQIVGACILLPIQPSPNRLLDSRISMIQNNHDGRPSCSPNSWTVKREECKGQDYEGIFFISTIHDYQSVHKVLDVCQDFSILYYFSVLYF